MTPIEESIYLGLSLLIDGGFKTYGNWSNELILSKVSIYSIVMSEDQRVTPAVIKETINNYLKGKITRYQDGSQVPVGYDMPTAPEFYDGCIQTFHMMYRTISIGESIMNGVPIMHTITVRKNLDEEMLDVMVTNERKRLGLPIPEPHKPLSHDQQRKAGEIIRKVFGEDVKFNEDEG